MANNCKAVFVNNTPLVCTVTDNGDGTYTFNNHIDPPVTWSTGGADTDTSIVFNQVLPNGDWEFNVVDVLTNTVLTTFTVPAPTISIIDNGDNTFTYIDVAGNPTVIAYEHTLVDNNDGTFTFTQPDGTPTTIDVCKLQQDSGCAATMVDNGDGTYTYTDIYGTPTTFSGGVANVLTTITNTITGHKIADYTDENGGVTPIYETISTLVNNGDGTATFTNEDGAVVTFPIGGVSIVDNTDGTYLVTLADGSTITIGDTSISTLVDNGDNTYTYTDETGVATTFDVTGVLTTVTNTIVGNKIADYTDEAGGVTPIYESVTSFASITNGWQFTSEDGTAYPFTFTFDNTTPSAPQLLVNYGVTTVATIPLNSYDVNIATTGGFALNPLTDVITITETDGETHTIDLSYLRSTLTSTDGSVQSIISINPDGSTNYDLGVKSHSNETQAVPYTGVELPSLAGVNIGDTKIVKFNDGTVVNYTWNGSAWVVDFVEQWYEQRVCLNTATPAFIPADPNNPTIAEVEAWKNANLSLLDQQNGTILTYYDPTPIYSIQPTLTINNPNSGVSVYSYRITSCIINSTELLTAPIDVQIANSYVYIGQIGTLIRNYFTSNSIIGQVDDGAFGEYNDVLIYGVQGSTLTISMTTEYSLDATPTTFVTSTVSGTTTAVLAPQVYNCDTPLFTFILNKDNTVSKISQPQSLFFKEQTIIDAGIDKYGRIYRYGNIGIGMNRPKAPLHILGVGDQYEPYLSDAAIYIGGNGKKIYWGDNLKTPESTANVHNLSLGEWNGDSDAFAFHAKSGHRFYVKATAWDDNNSTQYPAFFIRKAVSSTSNVGKIGLNTNNPRVSVDFGNLTNPDGIITNNDGMIIPGGTVAERPATPIAGTIRFNSDTSKFEGYTGTTWVDLH